MKVPAPTASVRRADAVERLLGERQTGGRRGDRKRLPREDGLIRLAVLEPVGPPDVRGQRNVADPLQERIIHLAIEAHLAFSVLVNFRHDGREVILEAHGPALLRAPAGPGQRFPVAATLGDLAEQEDLDRPPLFVASLQPRREDSHVVADEQVARAKQLRKVGKPPVRDVSGLPIEDEQPAGAARPRLLRNQVRREEVVEEIDAHLTVVIPSLPPVILSAAKDLLPFVRVSLACSGQALSATKDLLPDERSRFFVAALLRMT